jgi:hypothetical protein
MTAAAAFAIVSDDRPATSSATSPARAALAEHHASIRKLKDEVERASRPVDRLREQSRVAGEQLAAAERELAALDRAHAQGIRDQARGGTPIELEKPAVREKAQGAVDGARRVCNAVQAALAECTAELSVATAALRGAEGMVGPIMLDVLLGEHGPSVARWQSARSAFIGTEAELLGLHHAIAQRGRDLEAQAPGRGVAWLREWERLRGAWLKQAVAEIAGDIQAASARWSALLARLETDPNAAL